MTESKFGNENRRFNVWILFNDDVEDIEADMLDEDNDLSEMLKLFNLLLISLKEMDNGRFGIVLEPILVVLATNWLPTFFNWIISELSLSLWLSVSVS